MPVDFRILERCSQGAGKLCQEVAKVDHKPRGVQFQNWIWLSQIFSCVALVSSIPRPTRHPKAYQTPHRKQCLA